MCRSRKETATPCFPDCIISQFLATTKFHSITEVLKRDHHAENVKSTTYSIQYVRGDSSTHVRKQFLIMTLAFKEKQWGKEAEP